jgi:4-alpha-glucanotransferase
VTTLLRASGVLVPLFSLVSSRSWGVGEFLDLPPFAKWVREAGQSFVQVLPILEIPDHETSPYSALTAMALDPIFISMTELEDFAALGGVSQLGPDERDALGEMQSAPRVQHRAVRALKGRWLRRSHQRFLEEEAGPQTARFHRFNAFAEREAWWLDDYALFRALRGINDQRPWWEWAEPLAGRQPEALARVRAQLAVEIGYRQYVQWIAEEQWARARAEAAPVQVFGDVPFMISADSPDVWMRQEEFRFDATVGVPPDAFSETGQDWGLPPWRWDVMAQNDFQWMRRRARRTAALFDGFRLDHLVGLYRTFIRPIDPDTRPFFAPDEEHQQRELGEKLVRLYQDMGSEVIAEDLGTVPDFVRASLRTLGVPGFKVFRWERYWHQPEQPFADPAGYDEVSVATTGTHDTEALATWWETLPAEDRERIARLPSINLTAAPPQFTPEVRDALIGALLRSGSRFTIFPVQDLFGWTDRINTPATVDEANWSWRLPWYVDQLDNLDEPRERAAQLRDWTRDTAR